MQAFAERKQAPLPVTLSWPCTSCSARTLVGISLADGINLQSIHSNAWIENLLEGKRSELTKLARCVQCFTQINDLSKTAEGEKYICIKHKYGIP